MKQRTFCGGTSQADLAFVWGGGKQLEDREKPISVSVKEVSPPVTIPSATHV